MIAPPLAARSPAWPQPFATPVPAFLAINGTGLVLLGAVWMQGWIGRILAADDTHICKLIFALFVVGVAWTGQKVLMLSRELNALERRPLGAGARSTAVLREMAGRDGHTRTALAAALRLKLLHRIAPVRHMASTLVLLGLIGTIVGFIIALSGVNQAAVTDAAAIGPMVATLLHGMAMALFKTLVGSVLNVWLMVDYRLLEAGATHVLTHVDRDRRARCSRLTRMAATTATSSFAT